MEKCVNPVQTPSSFLHLFCQLSLLGGYSFPVLLPPSLSGPVTPQQTH